MTLLAAWSLWIAAGIELRADIAADFAAANRLYDDGKFQEAATAYERIRSAGQTSVALEFNLANSWFKAQRLGLAIAHYHRARRLEPRDSDILENLAFVRTKVGKGSMLEPWYREWLGWLRTKEWIGLASLVTWFYAGVLFAGCIRPLWGEHLRGYRVVAGLACAATILIAVYAIWVDQTHRVGVVILREAKARFSPLEESKEAFSLTDGVEVRVLETQKGWALVEAPNQSRPGWMQIQHLYLVK